MICSAIRLLAPQVLKRDDAAQRNVDRLVGYSTALLVHEIARRECAGSGSPARAPASNARKRTS